MEYRDALICRVMLLACVDRATAEAQVDAYAAGRIGRRELYAPPLPPPEQPEPRKKRGGPPGPRVRARTKRPPRVDPLKPRPFRSSGLPRINTEALGNAECLRPVRWQELMYEYDLLMATTLRMEYFVLHGDFPPVAPEKTSPGR